jgi:hypothetical protein
VRGKARSSKLGRIDASSPRQWRNWVIPVIGGLVVTIAGGLILAWILGAFNDQPKPHHTETTGSTVRTWTDYVTGGGTRGPDIAKQRTVQVACKLPGMRLPSNGNIWWYRISSPPWNQRYYASADAFYNNGRSTGPLKDTPFVDKLVPDC